MWKQDNEVIVCDRIYRIAIKAWLWLSSSQQGIFCVVEMAKCTIHNVITMIMQMRCLYNLNTQ